MLKKKCFDLGTFLRYNQKCTGAGWKCGVCNAPITADDIEIDRFLLEVIKSMKDSKQGSEDMDSVEVFFFFGRKLDFFACHVIDFALNYT